MQTFHTAIEKWPITGGFTISRETKTDAIVVTVTLTRGDKSGTGECVPLKRYGYTAQSVQAQIEAWLAEHNVWTREYLIQNMPPCPARFALDTAMWHLEAAEQNKTFWQLVAPNIKLKSVPTAFTLSGAAPDVMAARVPHYAAHRWLKIKLMGDGLDQERLEKIHAAAPNQDLIVDANEALTPESFAQLLPVFLASNVCVIEQPFPAGHDDALRDIQSPIPIAADESCHSADDLEKLVGKYQIVNLKLDKTGGLTYALEMAMKARKMGFEVMIGCMVSTSLSIEPAFVIAQDAAYIDLDGAMLLVKDRNNSMLSYDSGQVCVV